MTELLHAQLERSAERRGARVAVVSGGDAMTYAQLDAAANRIANLLAEHGVGPGHRVGLLLDKSLDAVASLYGIMKAGAAYLPLDPVAPATRVAHTVDDCAASTLISQQDKAGVWEELMALGAPIEMVIAPDLAPTSSVPAGGVKLLGAAAIASQPTAPPGAVVAPDDLALILYTSGSTGNPKGVMLTHGNVFAFAEWAAEEFGLRPDDRLSQLAPLHFDLSTLDLFAAARAGASVHLASRQTAIFPMEIRRFLEAGRISVVYAVPSILTALVERTPLEVGDLPDLRTVLFAGEVFPTKYLSRIMKALPHVEFANLFGPTETNVCTFYRVPEAPPENGPPVLIGRAIAGVETTVMDDDGVPVATGKAGELWVRGPTVMQGYWPSRTAATDPGAGVYRTGDIVRETGSGDYEFIGRRDSQIKSRGYRIELGDIEAAMLTHPGILECAVIPVPDDLVTNRITVSVVKAETLTEEEIRRYLAELLPRYMVPESFDYLDRLPKTSTGKIDRQRLIRKRLTPPHGQAGEG